MSQSEVQQDPYRAIRTWEAVESAGGYDRDVSWVRYQTPYKTSTVFEVAESWIDKDLREQHAYLGADLDVELLDKVTAGAEGEQEDDLRSRIRKNGGYCTYGLFKLKVNKGGFWDCEVRRAILPDAKGYLDDIHVSDHAVDRYIQRVLRVRDENLFRQYKRDHEGECVRAIQNMVLNGKVIYSGKEPRGEGFRNITVYRSDDFLVIVESDSNTAVTLYRYSTFSPYNWKSTKPKDHTKKKQTRFSMDWVQPAAVHKDNDREYSEGIEELFEEQLTRHFYEVLGKEETDEGDQFSY